LHKNLASGADVSLLIPENVLDVPLANLSPDQVMGVIVTRADTVVQCANCKRLAIARRTGSVDFFSPCESWRTTEFLEPWFAVTSDDGQLQEELAAELGPSHPLRGRAMRAVARRRDCDDVLFVSVDEPHVVAVVHLTYANRPELDPRFPGTTLFESMQDWIERGMAASENK
jgi:hypothetical protein